VTTGADSPGMARERRAPNRLGAVFILADMILVVAMTAIVKLSGGRFPAIQLVFLRAFVGLVVVLPLVWKYRREVFDTQRVRGHLGRVLCNALALTCNFAALVALPLALVTAIGFSRPFIPAGVVWVEPQASDLPPLLAIGLLAQLGQFCFLRAHQLAEIRVLAPLGFLSIVFSMLMDYAVFDLTPTWPAVLGAGIIVGSSLSAQILDRRPRLPAP
jgi:drug/metabolite transporter (DMT)-like permease